MKTIGWDSAARQEAGNALTASRDAVEFQRVIEEALRDIANGTIAHAQVVRSPCRQCMLPKPYPYSIVYRETADEIQVVAFPHHKRRTNYWKNRLRKKP